MLKMVGLLAQNVSLQKEPLEVTNCVCDKKERSNDERSHTFNDISAVVNDM